MTPARLAVLASVADGCATAAEVGWDLCRHPDSVGWDLRKLRAEGLVALEIPPPSCSRCDRVHHARGLCHEHYVAARLRGDLPAVRRQPRRWTVTPAGVEALGWGEVEK